MEYPEKSIPAKRPLPGIFQCGVVANNATRRPYNLKLRVQHTKIISRKPIFMRVVFFIIERTGL